MYNHIIPLLQIGIVQTMQPVYCLLTRRCFHYKLFTKGGIFLLPLFEINNITSGEIATEQRP